MTKISLTAQIEELEREIAMRREVYPRLVARGKYRRSEADLLMARMMAARDTLKWLNGIVDGVERSRIPEVVRKALGGDDETA